MPQFQPTNVSFGDPVGYGAWDVGHHREHEQFVQALALATPRFLLPNFDFLSFLTSGPYIKSIVQSHAQAHTLLRQALNITGTDLSAVDLENADDLSNWTGIHGTEHAIMRQRLGIT